MVPRARFATIGILGDSIVRFTSERSSRLYTSTNRFFCPAAAVVCLLLALAVATVAGVNIILVTV